jgi:hypothetical protein
MPGPESGARRASFRLRTPRRSLDNVLVCMGGRLSGRPAPDIPAGLVVEEMDFEHRGDVERWLSLHNDAYGRRFGVSDYRTAIVEHPHYDIRRGMFLFDRQGAIGFAAAGVFRCNPEIGVPHYITVTTRAQGRGGGVLLGRLQGRAMSDLGVLVAEGETQISRVRSLCMQFSFGWRPKYQFDVWNTPDNASPIVRSITNRRLRRLYAWWAAEHAA